MVSVLSFSVFSQDVPWFREFSLWATFVRGSESVCEEQLYFFLPSYLPSFLLRPFWWCWLALGLGIPLLRDERKRRWNHKSSAKRSPSRFTTGTIVTHSHTRVANPFVARFRYRLSAFVFLSLCLLQLSCCNYLMWLNFLICSSACLSWPNPT